MALYSFGTTLPADLGEGLFTSPLCGGGILPASFVVATGTIIETKTTCAFCENTLQSSHVGPKVGDHKRLEEIVLEHFIRKILGVEEESLGDASEIFPDDLDGTRYKRLLTSVKLCEGCIFHFAKNEETLLKDQLDYIGKMSGMRDYSEVLQDPWLDLKRLAYTKLKGREGTIQEKLQLISRMCPSNQNALKIIFTTPSSSFAASRGTPSGNGPSTSTPLAAATTATTQTQQLLVTSVGNFPIVSNCPTTGVVSMDISEVMNQEQEQQQSATCQFAVASDKGSISSSCAASPNHDEGKEMENSQDSTQTRMDQEVNDFISVQPDRNQGDDRQEEESKTEEREPAVVELHEDQESSTTSDNHDKHRNRKDSDADFDEGADVILDDTIDQEENQSQSQEPEKNIKKRAADNATKNKQAPITTQEMLDVLETSEKEDEEEEDEDEEEEDEDEEEEDEDNDAEERTETGRETPNVQCQKVVVCLDKLDPSKTPVKFTPAKNNPVLKTPPKNKPPSDTPSKTKTPAAIPSKSKTPSGAPSKNKAQSETPSKGKNPSEEPSKNKSSLKTPAKNNAPSETSSASSSTKSLSRKSSSAMPLSKKTAASKTPSKDSTPIKTSSKKISSEKTAMNPPPARTSSNSKLSRRGSVTPTPSDDEGTSSSKSRGKKRPLSGGDASEKMFDTKKLKDMIRSSPRESFTPPESKKGKNKKVFKIGNRYLTESSSSDDDNDSDKDSDVHFTDCNAADADSEDY